MAQKDYTGAAALQALMDALGSAADQAQEEHAAAGQAGALVFQEVKCAQEIENYLARKDYAGVAAAQGELVQRRSAPGHEKRDEKQRNGEKNERERKAKEEEYARNIDELLAQKDYAGAAALQSLMDTLGSAAGQAGALVFQEVKCAQEIENCLARKCAPLLHHSTNMYF